MELRYYSEDTKFENNRKCEHLLMINVQMKYGFTGWCAKCGQKFECIATSPTEPPSE